MKLITKWSIRLNIASGAPALLGVCVFVIKQSPRRSCSTTLNAAIKASVCFLSILAAVGRVLRCLYVSDLRHYLKLMWKCLSHLYSLFFLVHQSCFSFSKTNSVSFMLCYSFYSSLFSSLSKQDQIVKRRPADQALLSKKCKDERNKLCPAYDGDMPVMVSNFFVLVKKQKVIYG